MKIILIRFIFLCSLLKFYVALNPSVISYRQNQTSHLYDESLSDEPLKKAKISKRSSYSDAILDSLNCLNLQQALSKFAKKFFSYDLQANNGFSVDFYLALKNDQRIQLREGELMEEFDITRPTILIIHGFFSDSNVDWVKNMTNAFHNRSKLNVITVDWKEGAHNVLYLPAAMNTKVAAYQIAKFLSGIATAVKSAAVNIPEGIWEPIHCVGHSLGAHVCGLTSKLVHKDENIPKSFKIERITGLDPAHPCFKNRNNTEILHVTDASFVDVIHTNINLHKKFGLGLPEPIGHMDFYPNGGHSQYGCDISNQPWQPFLGISMTWLRRPYEILWDWNCSHGQGQRLFTESIELQPKHIFSSMLWDRSLEKAEQILSDRKCNPFVHSGCVEMGYHSIDYRISGQFFTVTANNTPFSDPNFYDREIIKQSLRSLNLDYIKR